MIPRRFHPLANMLVLLALTLPMLCAVYLVRHTRSQAAHAIAAVTREAAAEREASDAVISSYAAVLASSTATVADLRAEVVVVEADNAALAKRLAASKRKPRVKVHPRAKSRPAANGSLWTVTAYCSCSRCCGKSNGITASGSKAGPGTVAASLPFGTRLRIGSLGTFTVRDRGGSIRGKRLDVWMPSHAAAKAFGRRQIRVVVL